MLWAICCTDKTDTAALRDSPHRAHRAMFARNARKRMRTDGGGYRRDHSERSPNGSKSTRKNYVSRDRKACSCARSSPLKAQKSRFWRAQFEFQDPRGEPGWGLATWQPDVLKTQNPFMLPIPPFGMHVVRCCIRDWRAADKRAGVERVTKWVFASRVIQSAAGDIAVSGSAMANHIRNVRGIREKNHRDHLRGVPAFSMHIIRSTMGDYILDETDLPPGTASLMIGHEFEGDKKTDIDRISRTSKRWYFQAQRIPEKTEAMRRWCDALLQAYKDAGGIYPD